MGEIGALLDGIGSLLTGLAALFAAIFAAAAGKRELERWRQQRRDEKIAEIAAATAVALLNVLDGLQDGTQPLMDIPAARVRLTKQEQVEQERAECVKVMEPRWQRSSARLRSVLKQSYLAQAYLPPPVAQLFVEVTQLATELRIQQDHWLVAGVYGTAEGRRLYNTCMGAAAGKRIEALREKVLSTLRPFVHLYGSPSISTADGAQAVAKRAPRRNSAELKRVGSKPPGVLLLDQPTDSARYHQAKTTA